MSDYDFSSFDSGVQAHKEGSQYDFSHFDKAVASAPSTPTEPPGILEALLRGGEQGATMDFAPRVNAAAEAATSNKDYDTSLKEALSRFKAAQAAHPYAYGLGNIVGFTVPTLATGGENLVGEGLGKAIGAGATYGALSGVGGSDDLTNVSDVAKNALVGAGTGAAGGALGSLAANVGGALLKGAGSIGSDAAEGLSKLSPTQKFAKGYASGATSGMSAGEQAGTQAIQEAKEALGTAEQSYQQILRDAANKAENIRMNGPKIDHSDWFDNSLGAIDTAKNNFPESDPSQGAFDKLQNIIQGYRGKFGDELDPSIATVLKRKLGQLGSEGDAELGDVYARQLANRLVSSSSRGLNEAEAGVLGINPDFVGLKDVINNGLEGLPEQNKIMHQMLGSQDEFPDLNTLLNAEKGGRAGVEAQQKMADFYSGLPDSVVAAIKPQLDQAAQKAGVSEAINASSLGTGFMGTGIGKGALYAAGNVTGASVQGLKRGVSTAGQDLANGEVGSVFKTMYNQSPETFNTIGTKLATIPGALGYVGKALLGAADKDNYGRNAIIFALQQNPEYREAVEQHFGMNQQKP